jgi:ATP-dependent Clp protease protease subunit
VDGVAASAAATLAMAGDEIIISEGGFMMIHNASGIAMGDAKEMTRMAALLTTVNEEIGKQYADRAKMKLADVLDMMDAETWMTASDAVAKGFADKVAKGQTVTNMISNSAGFKNIPSVLKERPNRVRAAAMLASIRR